MAQTSDVSCLQIRWFLCPKAEMTYRPLNYYHESIKFEFYALIINITGQAEIGRVLVCATSSYLGFDMDMDFEEWGRH